VLATIFILATVLIVYEAVEEGRDRKPPKIQPLRPVQGVCFSQPVKWTTSLGNHLMISSAEHNETLSLRGVSWFGFESPEHALQGLDYAPLSDIMTMLRKNKINTVRVPLSAELISRNPQPQWSSDALRFNPFLKGKTALEALDYVVDTAGQTGLLIIFDMV
jgi:aryl-phospho-beta-D-glucosidase BglC (GH1 family)